MNRPIQAFNFATLELSHALATSLPDLTIEKLYQELVAAHQIWWETTDEWKAINAQFHDRHDV